MERKEYGRKKGRRDERMERRYGVMEGRREKWMEGRKEGERDGWREDKEGGRKERREGWEIKGDIRESSNVS